MKLGLIGSQIQHSLSKKLHHAIGAYFDLPISYEIIDISEDMIIDYMSKLRNNEYQGFNITTPYKEVILSYLDEQSLEVKAIQACNTVKLVDGKIVGYNTDYDGFLYTLKNHNISPTKAYILGSGGASKVCYKVLKDLGFEVYVVSRNKEKDAFFETVISYDAFYQIRHIPLLINATPIGSDSFKGSPIVDKNQTFEVIIDLIYNPKTTELMSKSNYAINGIEMLFYQAIKAEEWWHDTILDDPILLNKVKGELLK